MLGALLSLDDMKNYTAELWPALQTSITDGLGRNLSIYTSRTPSSGGLHLLFMNILDEVRLDPKNRTSAFNAHKTIEAMKFAYGHRGRFGDHNYWPMTKTLADVQSKQYAKMLTKRLGKWNYISNDSRTYGGDEYFLTMLVLRLWLSLLLMVMLLL